MKTKKPETTSKLLACIAGRVLEKLKTLPASARNDVYVTVDFGDGEVVCTVGELKAVMASALTQTADKKAK